MRTVIKIALGLAGFVAGFVVSGSAVLLLIYLFETLVQPSALLETHVWWLTFLIGGFGGMAGCLLMTSTDRVR